MERDDDSQRILYVSVEAALKFEYKDTVNDAVKKELHNNEVSTNVDYNTIVSKETIIPSLEAIAQA